MKKFNASNLEGTCLWCGDKLKPEQWRHADWYPKDIAGTGKLGRGVFCTFRCGFQFGETKALAGHRLKHG